jgi:multiple sugar transport system substrate-binding protein
LDVFLIDIVRPAQYAAAGWIEPLDKYLGADRDRIMAQYLPAYRQADVVDNRVVALPAFADATFLYYRKDLLQKYGVTPPKTWDELAAAARKIQTGEKNPNLQGLSFQGKAIEGAVCTFLLPYWSQGAELVTNGKLTLDKPKAEAGLAMWRDMVQQGVAKKNIAEVGTDDTRKEFQAGNVVFAVNWGYAWNHFQEGADSAVKDKVGVVSLPAMKDGKPAACMGGWQWAVSSFSKNKDASVKLVRWLASSEASKQLALKASNLPADPALYRDKEILAANGWFADALPVMQTARSRPVTPVYSEVSEAVRVNTNAVMAGVKAPADAVREMESRVKRILR